MIVNFICLVVGFVAGVLVGRVNKTKADQLAVVADKVKTDVTNAVDKIKK